MDYDRSDKVIVCLDCFYFLHGVVIEYSDLKIIRTGYDPVFRWDKFNCTDWES